jgi:hypothetical protein
VEKPHVTKAKKKVRQVKSNVKSMVATFFDIKGIVHKKIVPTGQTVNSGFYCDVLRRMLENVRRRRPELWREQTWLLHHDNTPKHKMAVIPHPPYYPDLAPCDFFLFPKMNLNLEEYRFDTIQEIQAESQRVLDTLTENDFQKALKK